MPFIAISFMVKKMQSIPRKKAPKWPLIICWLSPLGKNESYSVDSWLREMLSLNHLLNKILELSFRSDKKKQTNFTKLPYHVSLHNAP